MALSLNELEGLYESEFETEALTEGLATHEFELNPVQKIYPDALMEHMAHMALEAESEHEAAEHFLPLLGLAAGKLLPLAAKAIPSVTRALPTITRAVSRVTPQLTRGVSNITRQLFRNPRTRRLVHVVPTIARRTIASIARQATSGRPVTPQTAQQILRLQTQRVLRDPQRRTTVLQRSNAMDRQFHRLAGVPGPSRMCPSCGGTVRLPRTTRCACGHMITVTVR